jgi:hypothetical protein
MDHHTGQLINLIVGFLLAAVYHRYLFCKAEKELQIIVPRTVSRAAVIRMPGVFIRKSGAEEPHQKVLSPVYWCIGIGGLYLGWKLSENRDRSHPQEKRKQ